MAGGNFLTIEETASALGVSTRHARRLAESGAITRVARGLIDNTSVDHYLQSRHRGRTRAWAQHTAWGAAALLSGNDAYWLGPTQASRLRRALREIADASELVTRMRDRAAVHTYTAHRAALPRLRVLLAGGDLELLGISAPLTDGADGYLAESKLDVVIRSLGLRADAGGTVVLRVTSFDFDLVRKLADTPVITALDAATNTDPRIRGVGLRRLNDLMEAYR